MTPLQEITERGRRNVERVKRTNAIVCIVLGTIFGTFALVCFVIAIRVAAVSGALRGAAVGAGVFGLFWCALTALLVMIGRRGLKKLERDRRLRTSGTRAMATVLNYNESSLRVDGATNWRLGLRVALDRTTWSRTWAWSWGRERASTAVRRCLCS
jgi:membrane protein implicated in regulation of membrane protease activity